MAAMDVLQLADRPWQDFERPVRLPGLEEDEEERGAPEEPDAPGCDFGVLLVPAGAAAPPFCDVEQDGRSLHACFVEGVVEGAEFAYGAAGAASRRAARSRALRALESGSHSDCVLEYEDARVPAHRCVLYAQSAYCRGSLAHEADVVRLPSTGSPLRRVVPEIARFLYTRDERELEALLDACAGVQEEEEEEEEEEEGEPAAVCVARFADAALLWDLKSAALARLRAAVDDASAAPLLAVGESLDDDALRRACLARIVASGVDAARRAAGPDLFDACLPADRHDALRKLARMAASNPLQCGADLSDAKEAVAMLKEAADDMAERLVEADARQAKAERRLLRHTATDADRANAALVRRSIEKQRVALASLQRFARGQEALFSANEALDGDGDFAPTYDWRPVPVHAHVPAGLDVKLSFQGEQAVARIPPTWQLRLVVDDGFFRVDVCRDTRVADVLAKIEADSGKRHDLAFPGGKVVDPGRRFDAKLFRARQTLRAVPAT